MLLPILAALGLVTTAVLLPAPRVARAEADSFGLGTGRDGPLTVTSPSLVVNSYAQVTAPLAPGDALVAVSTSTGFAAGDLVMLLQTTGLAPEPESGAPETIDLADDQVGRWELARLAAAGGTTITLTAPLAHAYAAIATQIIRVPEYTTVTVNAGASISAPAWNGGTGGVVAFLASGTLTNGGQIRANGRGFRGGAYVDDPIGSTGCDDLDQPAPSGARKGEGIANTSYGSSSAGRGNLANGGGGGDCFKAGGGGGGNGGAGGMGGRSDSALDGMRDVGGLGGAALSYSLLDHLTFGGGGGAGHGVDGTGQPGGAGGGAIFIRAGQLAGAGTISAVGASPGPAESDAGAGGGAGGSIYLRVAGDASCSGVVANGGIGGDTYQSPSSVGPGGGGGGGRVLFQSAGGACPIAVLGVASGRQLDGNASGDISYGAGAGAAGVSTTLGGGFALPLAPALSAPAGGSFTRQRRPVISGTASPGVAVVILLDGAAIGRTTPDDQGAYAFTPAADLAPGPHQVQAAAELQAVQGPPSPPQTFTIDLTPPLAPIVAAPADGALTNSATPVVSGTAEPSSTVTIFVDGAIAGTTSADASGRWQFTLPAPLADRPHTIRATAVDLAGNVSPESNESSFTIDTIAPADPAVVTLAEGAVLYASTPTLTGTAEPSGTVTVLIDGALAGVATVDASGSWSFTTATALSSGPHTLQTRVADAAGNAGPLSIATTFTYTPAEAPALAGAAPAAAVYGASYSHSFSAAGVPTPSLSVTAGALPPGLALSGSTISGTPTAPGSYGPITVAASNGYGPAATRTFTIEIGKATLTATANHQARIYGGANPILAAGYSGFVGADTPASALAGSPSCVTTAGPTSDVGSYPIVCSSGTLTAPNYDFAFVEGTLSVEPARLTIAADNQIREAGAANPPFTVSYSGFVNDDTAGALTGAPSCTTTAGPASSVGTYPIACAPGTLAARNYRFTFVDGTLTVTKPPDTQQFLYVYLPFAYR